MVHAVTTYNSHHSEFIKFDINAVQLSLTIVTTQSHAHLLSISPKVNAVQDINPYVLKVNVAQAAVFYL